MTTDGPRWKYRDLGPMRTMHRSQADGGSGVRHAKGEGYRASADKTVTEYKSVCGRWMGAGTVHNRDVVTCRTCLRLRGEGD